jgi:hypothetical protein
MSEPVRIGLRLLGFLLLLLGLGILVIMVFPGPRDVADWMGNSCAHTQNGPSEQCTIWDVLSLLEITPILIIVGAVLALVMRPSSGSAVETIDLSGRRAP